MDGQTRRRKEAVNSDTLSKVLWFCYSSALSTALCFRIPSSPLFPSDTFTDVGARNHFTALVLVAAVVVVVVCDRKRYTTREEWVVLVVEVESGAR